MLSLREWLWTEPMTPRRIFSASKILFSRYSCPSLISIEPTSRHENLSVRKQGNSVIATSVSHATGVGPGLRVKVQASLRETAESNEDIRWGSFTHDATFPGTAKISALATLP